MKIVNHALIASILMGSSMQSVLAVDEYRTYPEVQTALSTLAQSNPGIVKYFSTIGTTIEGREIPAVKITNSPQADDPNKPDILFVGGQHAREWIGIEVTLRLAEYLVANYANDSTVQSLVDSREIWVIPVANPDGYIFSGTPTPPDAIRNNRSWRKNRRPTPGGEFGIDLNRNYDYLWGVYSSNDSADPSYHGSSAFSEPETQAVKNFIENREAANNPITRLIDYHSYSQLILYPWGVTADPAPDTALFKQIAEDMSDRIYAVHEKKYKAQKITELTTASGSLVDWAYGEKGILALAIELRPEDIPGSPRFELDPQEILPTFQENLPAALYFIGLSRGRLMDFEKGTDQAPIQSILPGMKFTTTQGYDWIFGDWRIQNYNGPYPDGAYFSNGNFFAWLGANQGAGRIDFTDSTHKTVGLSYSSYSSVFMEAYDDSNTLIKTVGGSGNLDTGQLKKLSVSGDISYVLVHDTGNYWLIDDLFVTDGLADAQAKVPGKFKRKLEVVEKFTVGSTKEFTLFSKQGTDLKIVLEWPGSVFKVEVIDPQGNIVIKNESSSPPIIVDLHTHSEGNWQIVVTATQLDEPEAVSLVVGTFVPGDIDSDEITNDIDNCPVTINPTQADSDLDSVGDLCDNCLTIPNSDQTDRFPLDGPEGPGNGIGDACEELPSDMDNDGIENLVDNCPYTYNPDQADGDNDGIGDTCDSGDSDTDGDGVSDSIDACAFTEPGSIVNPAGCSIDQLCPCGGSREVIGKWKNHGKYVSCIAKSVERFVELGLISKAEKDIVIFNAAHSDCGNEK